MPFKEVSHASGHGYSLGYNGDDAACARYKAGNVAQVFARFIKKVLQLEGSGSPIRRRPSKQFSTPADAGHRVIRFTVIRYTVSCWDSIA